MVKKFLQKLMVIIMIISISFAEIPFLGISTILKVKAESNNNYVYLSDIWRTKIVSKSVAYSEFYQDRNEPGDLISLLVNGEKTYFLKGVFAHAPSTVIYDISEYIAKGYDTFSAYLGVDTYAGSNGNGVKFTISVSDDNVAWTDVKTSSILKGNTEAEKISVSISGHKYLKLYADNLGNDNKDHAVYADAMIYNSNSYTPNVPTKIEWLKTTDYYDAELSKHTSDEILNNSDLRLMLLQRTFVSRVNYLVLQAWVNKNADNVIVLDWLFNDVNRLEEYILGGTPTGGSYVNSLTVLSEIYKKHKADFESDYEWSATLQKLMFATSLTHAATIQSWFSGANGAKVYSTGVGRYEVIKELFENAAAGRKWKQRTNNGTEIPYTFEYEQFQDLSVEEMRWVTDNNMSDEEFLWLNWYATATKLGYTDYSSSMPNTLKERNPYLYIEYGDGGNVGKDEYYVANPMCGVGNEFYDPTKRTVSCYEKYQLNDWESLKTHDKAKPTLWIAFEEDGVCGTLMHVGNNLQRVFGVPAAGLGQPGHGAYIYAKRVKNESTGKYYTQEWTTYNWVSGWDQSEKGERLLLDWGTRNSKTVFNSTYNLIYIPLAQQALNKFDKYRISELYMMMADVQASVAEKAKYYELALDEIPYHIKAWYNLLTLKANNGASSSELNTLGQRMMNEVGNAPTAIDELSNIIEGRLGDEFSGFKLEQGRILKELETTKDSKYMNVSGVNEVAKRLRGTVDNLEVASFSFDDNILKLLGSYANNNATFEYALDYSYDPNTDTVSANWIEVHDTSKKLTAQDLAKINSTNDIAIHIMGNFNYKPTNIYFIDITDGKTPTGLYANDLENKVIGATSSMEWKIKDTSSTNAKYANVDGWTKFSDKLPDLTGTKTVLIRDGAHGQTLASATVELLFNLDPEYDPSKSYISIDRLKVQNDYVSSQQNNGDQKGANAIDGNPNTFWHNAWSGADKERWIKIEVTDGPVEISKIDYMPRQDGGSNGRFLKTKIEVSLDGKTWTTIEEGVKWNNDKSTKTYYFETPTLAKYVRLTALESAGNFASAAMINLYENKVSHKVPVENLQVSYMTSGFIYNGEAKTPAVTVRYEDKELILGEDYLIEYKENINAGTAKIVLTGLGIYEGTKEFEFTISKATYQPSDIPETEMTVTIAKKTLKDVALPENWAWEDPNVALIPGETITAKAIYTGFDDNTKDNYEPVEITISVTQDKGHRPEITGAEDGYFDISNGSIPDINIFLEKIKIHDEEDGDIALTDSRVQITYDFEGKTLPNVEGTYHIYITVTDSHGNTSDCTIVITLVNTKAPAVEINDDNFDIVINDEGLSYTGNALTPNITITDKNGHILTEDVDYQLTFSNNTNAGKATVIIEGIGENYTGKIEKTFNISKASEPAVKPGTITVSSSTASLSDISLPEGWYWADESVELVEGENTITIIYVGDSNHKSTSMTITVVKEKAPDESEGKDNKDDQENKEDKDAEDNTQSDNAESNETNDKVTSNRVESFSNNESNQENGNTSATEEENNLEKDKQDNTLKEKDKTSGQGHTDKKVKWGYKILIPGIISLLSLIFIIIFIIIKRKKKDEE